MKLPNSQKDFEKIMKNVDFTRVLQITVPILQPVIIGGLWLLISKFDKRADALSKLIAIAEPIPTIDLNLPKPVVLASMYHSVSEFSDVLNEVIERLRDLELPTTEEIVKKVTDPIAEVVEDVLPDSPEFKQALADCVMNAKKNLPYGSYYIVGIPWIISCMAQKGYRVTGDWLKKELGI